MKSFEKDDLDQPAPGKGYLGDILQWWSKRFPGPLRSTAPSLAPFSDHQPTAHRHLDHELWKSLLKLIILLEQCWFWEKLWFVNRFSDDVAFTVENGLHQTGEQFNMKIGFLSRCISVIWKVLGWHYEYSTTFQYWIFGPPLAQWCSLEQVCRPNDNPKQTRASVQESGCDRTDRRFSESAGSTQSSATHRHGEAVGGIFLKYCVAFMKLFCGLGDLNIGLWSDEQVSCKLWYWQDSLESRYTAEWI